MSRLTQGRHLAMGLGTKQSNTWVTSAHRQARGSPGLAPRPPGPSFPICYLALLGLQARQAPLHAGATSWARGMMVTPPSCPGVPPETRLRVTGTREPSRASNGQV